MAPTGTRPPPAVAPARACAYAVIGRVFEQGAYADRALHAEAAGLDPRDRALATTLAYGTVQRRATLDHVLDRLSTRPATELDPPVLAALRLGLMQLLLLDGIAEHAAVHESVELVKRSGRGGAGLVNAVLRRATREGRAILAELDDDTPEHAATLHSVPPWLASLWWSELGPQQARALLRHINQPAENALRVNTLVASPSEIAAVLGDGVRPAPDLPEGLVLSTPFDAFGSELWARGAIMPQSRASMQVARWLAPRPGERVLDLCAAPGAKTSHLAALIEDQGTVTAVERHPGRADSLRRTLARQHVTCAEVEVADATESRAASAYDRVLVDPPCSGLGTLQSRPDLRWRASPERIVQTAALQGRLLDAAAGATVPSGTLVYSVCTISRRESEDVIDRFLHDHAEFEPDERRQLLPHLDHTDGFFIARLRRR